MKTILFPTDFSLNSIHAIRYGLNLFAAKDARFILFNAYVDPSVGASMTYVFEDQMREISRTMLEKLYEDLNEGRDEDLKMDLINRYGDLPYSLRPVIEEEEVDLVIMGSSGASGANISVFGSNAFATMRDSNCPVLTVPLQAAIKAPERFGLASEQELSGDEEHLSPLFDLAEICEASVMGIHVNSHRGSAENDTETDSGVKLPYINLDLNDPLQGIELAIGEHGIDALSIIIQKRSFLDKIFHKSVSKQIARQISIPILTLHR